MREVARFATAWNVQAQVSAAHENSAADGHWTVTAQGPGWRILTSFEPHYQFVMANERRTVYDYFMMMCGSAPFARTIVQPNGPDDLYAADGSLRDVVERDVVERNLG